MRSIATVLLGVLFTGTALAQNPHTSTEWTPDVVMQVRNVGSTALSPDGQFVAYTVNSAKMDGEESSYRTHIWVAATDGSWNRQFTRGEKSASSPAWSPDGSWLAFTSSRTDESQVWAMPARGGEAHQVTEAKTGVGSFAWSPLGTHIAYIATDPKSEEQETREKEKRDVILVNQNFRYGHLYVMPFEASGHDAHAQRLTGGEFHVTEFDWSPDGTQIAFAHQTDPRIDVSISRDISIVPADSGAVRSLVTMTGADRSPRWSPDGSRIAFVSDGGSVERIGLGDVWVTRADGSGSPFSLAHTFDRSAGMLGWTPDGEALMISESRRTYRVLYRLPANGDDSALQTPEDGTAGSFSFSDDGSHMAFTWQTTDQPAEVYVSGTAAWSPRKLSAANDHLTFPEMGRTELLTWESTDGFIIDGLLTYPVGYTAGTRVPIILQVHGGPSGVFSQTFTGGRGIYMTQVFAQKGYAVLRPNPRGSSGYGKEFRYANIKDWGFGDYEDLMSGVDRVIEMGVGDADRQLLMGWSYGGYMTSFAVTRTDRFKAASMGAGLPNLISMVTTTDIPSYLVQHFGGEFWDDYETYERHSAMYRIANVVTPTQVIHGALDLRVPFTQGQEFYVALDRRGIDTEMVVYPRTPHGPREPKLLMDVTPRILSWFERHLER